MDNKIKPIRKGVDIEGNTSPLSPQIDVVETLKELLRLAEEGELREFAYAAVGASHSPYLDIVGDNYNYSAMHCALSCLKDDYYVLFVKPALSTVPALEEDEE